MYEELISCRLCPRRCGANRLTAKGMCGTTDKLFVARAALHFWEEPCISGERGSGAVFFSGCPLGCVYCQNKKISSGSVGKEISVSRLGDIFLELQSKGALNINLVTPMHYALHVKDALIYAKKKGLCLPVVCNTSGYESVETLKLFDGLIDVYLPDFKYYKEETALKFSSSPDYPETAKAALDEMFRQVGAVRFGDDGIIKGGMIVRHLVLPRHTREARAVIKYLFNTFGNDIFISIMNQYTPMGEFEQFPELSRTLSQREYDEVVDYALFLGIENAYIQETETAKESFIPDFNTEGV